MSGLDFSSITFKQTLIGSILSSFLVIDVVAKSNHYFNSESRILRTLWWSYPKNSRGYQSVIFPLFLVKNLIIFQVWWQISTLNLKSTGGWEVLA